jgi:ribosomal protein L7/L12
LAPDLYHAHAIRSLFHVVKFAHLEGVMDEWVGPLLVLAIIAGLQVREINDGLQGIRKRQWEMERKLDALLKHAGVQFDPYAAAPPLVLEALRAGDKVEAIRLYRQLTGASRREARDFVEEVQRRAKRA